MASICIIQSNYIPWKGYFDLIADCDWFVVYDEVQFTKNDWRNRNQIKTQSGLHWLSIPVGQDLKRRVADVELPAPEWRDKHWKTLKAAYGRAPYSKEVFRFLEPLYFVDYPQHLTTLNVRMIRGVMDWLGIKTKVIDSRQLGASFGRTERLVDICGQLNASVYVSGPAAKGYLDVTQFERVNMRVKWFDYSGYPEYPQLWGGFEHRVSIFDLMFNCGPDARRFMKFSRYETVGS
jgi:hypothetical protein